MEHELYKKYRPSCLEEIYGNEEVVESVRKRIENDTLPSFILLHGPAGTGKTTTALVIAKMLGAERGTPNLKEINASDNTGVDSARDITSRMQYKPIGGKKNQKVVWVIDECHRLTSQAQSQMLKPLEDTPKHAVVIFCTSEPAKISAALKTRATVYEMKPLSNSTMLRLLKSVVSKEDKEVPRAILSKICENACGSSRKALVELDKVLDINEENMLDVLESFKQEEEGNVFELFKEMIWGKAVGESFWDSISSKLEKCLATKTPEEIRRALMTMSMNRILKPGQPSERKRLYELTMSLKTSLFNNDERVMLIYACRDFFVNGI